jgi:riboflavin kinase/FMN adenylyltransferase
VLLQGLGARHVVCGYDFTFGARRGGNVEMLREKGREKGFGVTVLDPVTHEGEIYSSTRIREALRAGWVSEASELLGHSWEIEGVVELGDQRGRTIGFPTANVALGEHLGRASASMPCAPWSTAQWSEWRAAVATSAAARPSASSRRTSRSTCSTSRATSTARPCAWR